MSFGGQTVGFVTITDSGSAGYLGLKPKSRTLALAHGVQFWPLETTEAPDAETNVTSEVWRFIGPPDAAALAAKSIGELVYDGTDDPADIAENRFQIVGPKKPRSDGAGTLHHVTIMCKRQAG